MEPKFAAFIGLATALALSEMRQLSRSNPVALTKDLLGEAVRTGQRRALVSMFPGLIRHPFTRPPQEDIAVALRYAWEYEQNSESSVRMNQAATDAPSTPAASFADTNEYKQVPQAAPVLTDSDTSNRREVLSGTSVRLRAQGQVTPPSDRAGMPPSAASASAARNSSSATPKLNPTTAPVPLHREAADQDATPTRLQKFSGAAPIFPWERGKRTG